METFKAHLDKFIKIDDEEFSSIFSYFQILDVKKKHNLMLEGEICRYKYFVLEGCLRKFFINEKGVEQTTEFAIENWWISDTFAFEKQIKTEFNIQAVEKSSVVMIDFKSQEKLFEKHPIMERYFRITYQRAYAAAERRIRFLHEMSREEMYVHFSSQYPWFIQRIPQYLIASFLGFTPEYLSEIRAKLRS
ncbi:Crp/Fnr family transcriptional regulator [Chryseobacterium chendengshani]|uniref:Crp/Fnr family transcriptional regulator n=1 Tax=unclassified Chryseobacterium TaxID=2593645 RepID=UPI001C63F67A|nr:MULTISPECIES: Crp/Fnr family transcriptional regulator [unclassified Chryseobacterium]MBW7676308.1 Crp/Fnr family transcriptional regulator [Chryseobacterium sp. LJ756]MBW8524081.1 Crp/Fnr family transcriptional regulator [Chryseobacterium sp. LJ668]QYK17017.1 Crp/Fnr family transcriptional regulator [Chryseobacterium sp. LJ668]